MKLLLNELVDDKKSSVFIDNITQICLSSYDDLFLCIELASGSYYIIPFRDRDILDSWLSVLQRYACMDCLFDAREFLFGEAFSVDEDLYEQIDVNGEIIARYPEYLDGLRALNCWELIGTRDENVSWCDVTCVTPIVNRTDIESINSF